jgi:hypothetical protein
VTVLGQGSAGFAGAVSGVAQDFEVLIGCRFGVLVEQVQADHRFVVAGACGLGQRRGGEQAGVRLDRDVTFEPVPAVMDGLVHVPGVRVDRGDHRSGATRRAIRHLPSELVVRVVPCAAKERRSPVHASRGAAASSAARSSADSTRPAASAFSVTLAWLRVPGIGTTSGPRASNHARAS